MHKLGSVVVAGKPCGGVGLLPFEKCRHPRGIFSVLSPADYWTTGRRSMPSLKIYFYLFPILQARNKISHECADRTDTFRGGIKSLSPLVGKGRYPESGREFRQERISEVFSNK
jgi:hypothetical protein